MASAQHAADGSVTFSTTLSAFGNNTGIEVPAEVLDALGGDAITVTLTLATAPREASVPDDFAAAMAAAKVRPFFDGLSNSLQRFHIDNVNGAKSADTRARRVEKAVGLFVEGKQR